MTTKQKKIVIAAVICFMFALVIFYYNNIKIPSIQKEAISQVEIERDLDKMPKSTVAVVKNKDGIDKYTLLSDKIVENKNMIELIEIPNDYVVDKPVIDLDQLKEKVVNIDLKYNQQISTSNLTREKDWFSDFDRLKEFKVKTLVGDTAKEGHIVDVIIDYGDGNYDVVLSKVKIEKIISPYEEENIEGETSNNKSNPAARKDEEKFFLVIFSIKNEEEYRNLKLASELGIFETRLYIDESQPPSQVTFNSEQAIKKLKLQDITQKIPPQPIKESEKMDEENKKEEGNITLGN